MPIFPGDKFGRLTVIDQSGWRHFLSGNRQRIWHCVCECGKETDVYHTNLTNNHTRSCGCLEEETRSKIHTKHGHCKGPKWTKMYHVWRCMLQRCNDTNAVNYERYGARGIRVKWESFQDFIKDMESSWKPGLTIDRINNDGHYEPGNCKWSTAKEQAANRRPRNPAKRKNQYA